MENVEKTEEQERDAEEEEETEEQERDAADPSSSPTKRRWLRCELCRVAQRAVNLWLSRHAPGIAAVPHLRRFIESFCAPPPPPTHNPAVHRRTVLCAWLKHRGVTRGLQRYVAQHVSWTPLTNASMDRMLYLEFCPYANRMAEMAEWAVATDDVFGPCWEWDTSQVTNTDFTECLDFYCLWADCEELDVIVDWDFRNLVDQENVRNKVTLHAKTCRQKACIVQHFPFLRQLCNR